MGIIKGITIKLQNRIKKGTDSFGTPIYEDDWINVDNVLIGEPTTEDIAETLTLHGKKLAYTLAIPKGDSNEWRDRKVKFFNQTFQTIGTPTEGIEDMIPLSWNKKVKVEHYE